MKKIVFILSMVLIATTCASPCMAKQKKVTYKYNASSKTLTVSGKYLKGKLPSKTGGYNQAARYKYQWSSLKGKAKKITLKKGVERIGHNAFGEFAKLNSVKFPNTLKKIDAYAFGSTPIYYVYLPDSVKYIGVRRVVYIIETSKEKDNEALETVRGLFTGSGKDFITAVDEKDIILVKELAEEDTYDSLEKTAQVIVDMLNTEAMARVHVAYGTIINDIKEVSRSYKEAKMALDVGKIFYGDKNVMAYSNLGIGRLIYQLPMPLCKMFIKEIFAEQTPNDFDEETLTTINKFFENNLNVSETSRQLYIHRNTLVYRLDKLQKSTGLDLRVFEDAITFQIALMVVKYMNYLESIDF